MGSHSLLLDQPEICKRGSVPRFRGVQRVFRAVSRSKKEEQEETRTVILQRDGRIKRPSQDQRCDTLAGPDPDPAKDERDGEDDHVPDARGGIDDDRQVV